MKRRITLSIALALSIVLVSLMSSDSTAKAQPGGLQRIADTGFVPLGQGQFLRLTIKSPRDSNTGQFRRGEYTQGVCNGGVCKHALSSQTTSPPIMLESGEAASFDITPMANSSGVRGVVLSNNRNIRVNALIINSNTGGTVSYCDMTSDGGGWTN